MKKQTFFIFVTYVWVKTLLGVTFYPYKSTREIIRRPVLLPVIFSPLLTLLAFFILGRVASTIIIVYGLSRQLIAIILGGAFLSILLWQALLIYLLGSFLISRWKN